MLVSTDLAARGLDLPRVTAVIQFDFPVNSADYLHRAGRTARAGSSGEGKHRCIKRRFSNGDKYLYHFLFVCFVFLTSPIDTVMHGKNDNSYYNRFTLSTPNIRLLMCSN